MKKLLPMLIILVMTMSFAQAQEPAPEAAAAAAKPETTNNPIAIILTSVGEIRIELFQKEAPATVANFIQYANDDFYNGTIFHRVISYFMIQGGGMTPDMERKPTRDPVINEADNGLKNLRGTVAMARTSEADSATAQFFVNVEVNRSLDHTGPQDSRSWGYTVFGKVIQGMEVVDEIRFVETGGGDVPITPVIIESVVIE